MQIPIVPGYAFMDYKAQGQMMECVIIDISKPPTGKLSVFGVYVALSRSRGRNTICILRNFDPDLLMHHPSEDLRVDMARLEQIDERTRAVFEQDRYVVNIHDGLLNTCVPFVYQLTHLISTVLLTSNQHWLSLGEPGVVSHW